MSEGQNLQSSGTKELAQMIDHTLLRPTSQLAEIKKLCLEAHQLNFFSVCVAPIHVKDCVKLLQGSKVKVCTVIGFPTGAHSVSVKRLEAQEALEAGADELDLVVNLSWMKDHQFAEIQKEVRVISQLNPKVLKVILETRLFEPEEIRSSGEAALAAGAHFLKTSTGFQGGASLEAVRLLRQVSDGRGEVKASGGIRDATTAQKMIEAGATRIGTSSGPAILAGLQGEGAY